MAGERRRRWGSDPDPTTTTSMRTPTLLQAPARRSPGIPQRQPELGPDPACRRAQGIPQQHRTVQQAWGISGSDLSNTRVLSDHVVSGDGRSRPSEAAHAGVQGLRPRRIRELEPRVLQLTHEHLDTALENKSFDYITEFASLLPMDVISELVGVPRTRPPALALLADAVMHREDGVSDVLQTALVAAMDLLVYYADMVKRRRTMPADDLTSALLEAEIDGDRLGDDEIMAFLFLMVVAGNETTTKLLGNAMYWGAKEPRPDRQRPRRSLADPTLGGRDVALRHLEPDPGTSGIQDIVFHNTTLHEGDTLLLVPGSAHRDERVFDDPDEFRIGRDIGSSY